MGAPFAGRAHLTGRYVSLRIKTMHICMYQKPNIDDCFQKYYQEDHQITHMLTQEANPCVGPDFTTTSISLGFIFQRGLSKIRTHSYKLHLENNRLFGSQ